MSPANQTVAALRIHLESFDLKLRTVPSYHWTRYSRPATPHQTWHRVGWTPSEDSLGAHVQPERFHTTATTLHPSQRDVYLRAVSLYTALAHRAGEAGLSDPESALAALMPGGLTLITTVALEAAWQDDLALLSIDPTRDIVATVGLQLSWSGYTGTITALRYGAAVLQLTAGPAVHVPDGDPVAVKGAMRRLVIPPVL